MTLIELAERVNEVVEDHRAFIKSKPDHERAAFDSLVGTLEILTAAALRAREADNAGG